MGAVMDRKKVFLTVQSAMYVLLAVFLAAAVIGIYRDGLALKAENPLAWTFSREKVAECFRPVRPLFFLTLGVSLGGLLLDVKHDEGLKPVKGGLIQNKGPAAWGKTVRIVLLAAAVCLLVAGVFNGTARDVFGKAVKICTECVGLG